MSQVYVTSDWHFGHKGITRFRTEFESLRHMEKYIMDKARERLAKNDILIMIGDIAFTVESLQYLRRLKCRKILVRGNHDRLNVKEYLPIFEDVQGAMKYDHHWITHIPIHPTELYRGANVHGHCHRGGPYETQSGEEWWRYYNAILEYNNYRVVPWEEVKQTIKDRTDAAIRRNIVKAAAESSE